MNTKEKKELALSKTVLMVLAVLGLLVVIWLAWIRPNQQAKGINSFDECAKAGYPVQESYPEVCTTPDGRRFVARTNTSPAAQLLVIKEWEIEVPLTDVITDAYYSFDEAAQTALVSTPQLDQARARLHGCTSGLHALTFERAKPGDAKDDESTWTEDELKQQGTKVGDYYYFEKSMIETLCLPADGPDVSKIEGIQAALRQAFKDAHASSR